MITLATLLHFILQHPDRDKVLKDYTTGEISSILISSLQQNALYVVNDSGGGIEGIVACNIAPEYKVFHVRFILIKRGAKGVMRHFVEFYRKNYAGWDMQRTRFGNLIRHENTDHFIRWIEKVSK